VDTGLAGKGVLVTGASGGIGSACARAFAAEGARVVVNDLGVDTVGEGLNSRPAQAVVDEIRTAGGDAVTSLHDITDASAAQAAVGTAVSEFGRIDIVVNNAGFQRNERFGEQSPESFRAIVETHLFGSANVTRAAWAHMVGQRYGRVVMTTSAVGLWGAPASSAYAAAKAGVAGLARTLALEGEHDGIKVNSVAPAAQTRMSADRFPRPGSVRWRPELVVPAVCYLAHRTCRLNGAIVAAFAGHFAEIDVVQRDGLSFDPRSDITAEDIAHNLDEITAPKGASAFANGHLEALGKPIGRDLAAAVEAIEQDRRGA